MRIRKTRDEPRSVAGSGLFASATLCALAISLCLTGRLAAQSQDERRIAGALAGYERAPGESYWRAQGPETVAALRAIFGDRRHPAFIRLRALRAAAHYRTEQSRAFLLSVARKREERELYVREALLGLARAFAESAGDQIAGFLQDEKPTVRKAASEALGLIGSGAWRKVLIRRLGVERDATVRVAIERALTR